MGAAAAVWVARVEVSSVARRIQQLAVDAAIEVEDLLADRRVRPVELIVHHGAFPGVIIIGSDQSWLHQPTLFRTIVR